MTKVDTAKILRQERSQHFLQGMYEWSQVAFAYNNNHMEGSALREAQVRQLYHTETVFAEGGDPIKANDIIETQNHFRLFDFMLDTIDQPLTLDYVKKLQGILKQGTISRKGLQEPIGEFKSHNNIIGQLQTVNTVPADQVPQRLEHLLDIWNKTPQTDLNSYAAFHYEFERIHPFSDGNGRVGRILLFKERCRNKTMPFIIADEDRPFYIRGLREFKRTPGYLVDTFGNAMDEYSMAFEQVYGRQAHQKDQSKIPPKPKKSPRR